MTDLSNGFPSNLAFKLKQLSSFTKSIVKCVPDRPDVAMGETTRIKLPSQGLIDFRTISIYADASAVSGHASYTAHFPRYWSSLISQMTLTANGVQIANINEYGLLYNLLHDMEASSIDMQSKRAIERYDPSVQYTSTTINGNTPIVASRNCSSATADDTNEKLVINNFCGVLGSLSTPCLDLGLTGDVYLDIRWNNASVLWASSDDGAQTLTGASWNLKNVRLTCSRINFGNSDYYDLIGQKLDAGEPLLVGFYDYFHSRGTSVNKGASIQMNFNFNTNSLDQCIFTCQHSDWATFKNLILPKSTEQTLADVKTFDEVRASPVTYTGTAGTASLNDVAFNNSYYFKRAGNDLTYGQWTINSVNISPYPRPLEEIFNECLTAIGNVSDDKTVSGLHAGITNLYAWAKCYFCDILSLENISGDGEFWRSGLDSRSSTINIAYNATFNTTNQQSISPIIFVRSTKILSIGTGRLLSII